MKLIPIETAHFYMIELQERQSMFQEALKDSDYQQLLKKSDGYSLINGLDCLMMAGVIDAEYGRGISWCFLSKDAYKHMRVITNHVRFYLDNSNYNRIETTVETDFEQGHRWAKMLGMTKECDMKNYCNGKSHSLYARYK